MSTTKTKAKTRHPSSQRSRPPARRRPPRRRISPVVAAVAVVFLLAALATVFTVISGGDETARETAPVTLTGTALPPQGASPDAAIGMRAPEARGVGFDGSAVEITNDGRAKAILFLAHWCPHCQREVPVVVDWLSQTGGVEGVDVYAVSTQADPARPNWPPSAWLKREHWTRPTLVDDRDSSVADAFGLSGTPLWVFVKPDGTVSGRIAGEVPVATFSAQMRALVKGQG